MEQQGGLFGFLEKYLMGPMGKVSTWRPVRAIVGRSQLQVWGQYHLPLLAQCF